MGTGWRHTMFNRRYYTTQATVFGTVEVLETTTLRDGLGRTYEYLAPAAELPDTRAAAAWMAAHPLRHPLVEALMGLLPRRRSKPSAE